MKKFCEKIGKPTQWRVTVPNSQILKKDLTNRNSGSYDFEEAQREYDRSRSLPNSVYIESSDEDFEDASERHHHQGNNSDSELYVDVNTSKTFEQSKNVNHNNSQYEYDVPKISFKFFAKDETPRIMKSELTITINNEGDEKIVVKSGSDTDLVMRDGSEESDDFYKVPRPLQVTKKNRLSRSLSDFNVEDYEFVSSQSVHVVEVNSPEPAKLKTPQPRSSPQQPRSPPPPPPILTKETEDDLELLKCPKKLDIQVVPAGTVFPVEVRKNSSAEKLDYIKTRNRLPLKLRRPTFLRKPQRAFDTWNHFRAKLGNMMTEQAEKQRVGAYNDREKVTINFEEVYKNSKTKCKQAFRSTGKIFRKNSADCSSETTASHDLVKNDYFFDRVNSKTSDDCDEKSDSERNPDFDFATIKSAFKRKFLIDEGQNGFEDLRRYVKQGGDFSKELSTILQERAEAETQYAKNLSKLSAKLSRACRDGIGGLNDAWKQVALELEDTAECHRLMGLALLEDTARPLRNLTENQHRIRKQCENAVDKAARLLADWRAAEAKSKKQSHACARDNEKLQDSAILDTTRSGKLTLSRSTSLIQLAHMHNKTNSDKETAKLEGKKRKAEDAVKKADIEYYTLCVRAERARLEWESAVLRGVNTFQSLEEERLTNLKTVLSAYLHHGSEIGPRLIEAVQRLRIPVSEAEPAKDLCTFVNLRQSSQQISEQLLPDFYCEHITLAMNRERRKQALVKLLHLIRQDIERERKSKNGLENLSKAIKQTPNFGAEDSQQSVSEKLYHMKSMLTYLEGARYKVHNALAELDSRPKTGHPLAPHITVTRDKSGLQQSVLKVPQWLKEEWMDTEKSPLSEKSVKSDKSDKSDNSDPHNNDIADTEWTDRGAADGNSNQPDSDFDEFSSQCSSGNVCSAEEIPVQPIAQCRALYAYTPNLTDELALRPGDRLSVYRKQDDGWWLGECGGNVGIFPATYVEITH